MENRKIKILAVMVGVIFLFLISPRGNLTEINGGLDYFNNLNLEAKAVLVFDLVTDKPIFEFNSNVQLPLASLTKIMTVVMAEETKIKDISKLVDKTLMQSKNEAAIALASANNNFVDLMNKKAEELSLNQTYFLNETGLDISKQTAGALGSANDVAKLITYALKNNQGLFEATLTDSYLNTNPFATTTTLLIASKTGLTDLAGGNLAIVFDAGFNHPVVSVVLGSSEKGRFTDTKKLIDATFKYLANL